MNLIKIITRTSLCCLLLTLVSCDDPNSDESKIKVGIREDVMDITFAFAEVKGLLSNPNEELIKRFGVCYSTSPNPEITDIVVEPITGFEFFTCFLYDLEKNTTYYVRSFVEPEESDVVYSEEISFTTNDLVQECFPPINNVWGLDFDMSIGTGGWTNGEFVIRGQGLSADLYIEFREEPRSGVYRTVGTDGIDWGEECAIVVSRSLLFYASQLQRVDVENLGDGKFNIFFCDMDFLGNPTGFVSDGHIVVE